MFDFHGITRSVAVATLLAATVSACGSYTPGKLYDRAADVFSGTSSDSAEQTTPNLSTVPARPTPPSQADRAQAQAGLVADRDNAQYTEQAIRNPQAPLPPPSAVDQTVSQRPVATAPTAAVAPADPVLPQGAPTVRLVNGQIVASPGFFSTEAPANSAPSPAPAPVQTAAEAVPVMPATRVAANPTPVVPADPEPDVVPDAPPPPPFDLPKPPPPRTPAVASVPLPAPAPAPVARPAPQPAPVPAPVPAPQPMPAPVAQPAPVPMLAPMPAPMPAPASRPALASAGSAIAVIYFGDGKSALDDEARHVLTQVADIYRLHGGTLRVVGYSGPAKGGDAIRASVTALTLASARADAVANGLEGLGLQHDRIERQASGDAQPMIDEGRNTGVAGTRRAEIWLDY